jgi:iron(II)-dependent oxidoreductase
MGGVPPFQGETITQLCVAVVNEPARPPSSLRADIPPGLERVVMRCLEKDRSLRYQTVEELAVELAAFGGARAWTSVERVKRALDLHASPVTMKLPVVARPPGPSARAVSHSAQTIARPMSAFIEDEETVDRTLDTVPKVEAPPALPSAPGPRPVFVGSAAGSTGSRTGLLPPAGAITGAAWQHGAYPAPVTPPARRRRRVLGALVVMGALAGLAAAAAVMLRAGRPAEGPPGAASESSPSAHAESDDPVPTSTDSSSRAASLPPEMVVVPEGDYPIGCDPRANRNCFDDEKPGHVVHLRGFSLMRFEVTVEQYGQCVAAGVCPRPGHGDGCNGKGAGANGLPARCIDWEGAQAYCAERHMRLPTELEWEAAARGTDRRSFPWGEEAPSCERAVISGEGKGGCGSGGPMAPGSRPLDRSWAGAFDLGGNVREWTSSDYAAYPGGNAESDTKGKVNRGGSWTMKPGEVDASYTRNVDPPEDARPDLGFRCAADS